MRTGICRVHVLRRQCERWISVSNRDPRRPDDAPFLQLRFGGFSRVGFDAGNGWIALRHHVELRQLWIWRCFQASVGPAPVITIQNPVLNGTEFSFEWNAITEGSMRWNGDRICSFGTT